MLKNDSRKIKKGDVFIAIDKGHDYVEEAIKKGAKLAIVEKGDYKNSIKVKNTNDYLHAYIKNRYLNIVKDLKLIGITGTNGKTTTSYLIYQALNELNIKCAYIGTIGFYINEKKIKTLNTTPDILNLYHILLECVKENIEYVVMEVSSQGLFYNRIDGLKFDYTIFTNLTEDHLDFHKTMDNYVKEKVKLFNNLKNNGIGIVNSDDKYFRYFITRNTITFGKNGNYKLSNLTDDSFYLNNTKYKTKLLGNYNKYNLSCVIILLKCLKINNDKIIKIISSLNAPQGRMETVKYKNKLIIIDYAHSPDSVKKIITTLNNKGNVITVIGCGGNREKEKRPLMGLIATKYSNYVIFTSDNPRYEEPKTIIEDMIKQIKTSNYEIALKRKKAIEKGVQKLKNNDILLILGKGHEDYQEIKGIKYPFSDRDVVNDIIRR